MARSSSRTPLSSSHSPAVTCSVSSIVPRLSGCSGCCTQADDMTDETLPRAHIAGQGWCSVERTPREQGGEAELYFGRWWPEDAPDDEGLPVVLKRRADSDEDRICWQAERQMLTYLAT